MMKNYEMTDPPCPYYGQCGGCQIQHLTYPSQLLWKENLLKEKLHGLVSEDKIRPILPSPKIWNYRRRIQVHATPK